MTNCLACGICGGTGALTACASCFSSGYIRQAARTSPTADDAKPVGEAAFVCAVTGQGVANSANAAARLAGVIAATAQPAKDSGDAQSVRDAWISVDERLPEHEGLVLATGWKRNEVGGERYHAIAHFHRQGAFYEEESGDELYPPTHWQPLPAPPQKPVSDEVKP